MMEAVVKSKPLENSITLLGECHMQSPSFYQHMLKFKLLDIRLLLCALNRAEKIDR